MYITQATDTVSDLEQHVSELRLALDTMEQQRQKQVRVSVHIQLTR